MGLIKSSTKEKNNSVEITFKGKFDMQNLYIMIRQWLEENDFEPIDGGDVGYREKYYFKRVVPGYGDELDIWWRLIRKKSPIFHHKLNIDFHTLGLTKTEMVHEGKKIKIDKGEVKIKISSTLLIDPDKKFSKYPWLIQRWFFNRLYKNEYEENKDKLFEDINKLYQLIKQYLEVNGFISDQPMLKPSKGLW